MKPLLVLVLDGDPERRQETASLLRQAGHQVAIIDDSATSEAIGQAISSAAPATPESLEEAERRHLALVLRHTSGNKRKAALLLGISRSTLLNKVRKYGLED